jgi:hypothetical protein
MAADREILNDVKRRVLSEGPFQAWRHSPLVEARRQTRQDAGHRLEAAQRTLDRARMMLRQGASASKVATFTENAMEQVTAAMQILAEGER